MFALNFAFLFEKCQACHFFYPFLKD